MQVRLTCASPLDDVVEMIDSVVSALTVNEDLSSNLPAPPVFSNITDAADRRCYHTNSYVFNNYKQFSYRHTFFKNFIEHEQQRVAVGPGNAHFISDRQVSSDAATPRRCTCGRRCCR